MKKSIVGLFVFMMLITMNCQTAFANSYQEEQHISNHENDPTNYTKIDNKQIEYDIVYVETPITKYKTNLSPKVKEEFQKYFSYKLKNENINPSDIYVPTVQEIQEFVDYAARNGIIENSPAQKASITKEVVRASMKIVVAAGKNAGYKLAAECLDHSLQDYPSSVTYSDGSWQCNIVKTGTAYKNLITTVKNTLRNYSSNSYSTTGSMVLNSPTDLFLALNKVSYVVTGNKSNGTWTIAIDIKDTYNFEYHGWMSAPGISGAAATALNNYGAYAQSIGAVVPYGIKINARESYRP